MIGKKKKSVKTNGPDAAAAGVKTIRRTLRPSYDFGLMALTCILVIFGVVMVFSASYYSALSGTGSPFYYLKRQALFAVLGFILMVGLTYIDYHVFRKIMPLILLGSFALLGAVLVPGIGTTIGGATRWIYVGPISIMPGEIAKFAIIVFIATFMSRNEMRIRWFVNGLVPVALVVGAAAALIVKQPNLSTALTLLGIAVGMMYLAGLHKGWFIVLVAFGVVGFFVVAGSGTYWADRITSFFDPFADPKGDGYQVVQSLLALGTGGLRGLGLGKSIQKNLYLPMPQNDFITAIIGEELGLIGILLMLVVFILLIWRGMRVAMNAPDRFGLLLAGGIMLMIGIQVILNVAVVTSSMPATGIALPFISYGGNALWICMGSMGIVLNISKQANRLAAEESEA